MHCVFGVRYNIVQLLREIEQQIAADSQKTTAVLKHYGIQCRSGFSTEGRVLCVLFCQRKARKRPRKEGFLFPGDPQKSLGKKGKHSTNKGFLASEKARNSKQTRQGRSAQSSPQSSRPFSAMNCHTKDNNFHQLSGPISRDIAILSLRYPISHDTFREVSTPPKWCDIPTWCYSHRHMCAIPHFATYRTIIVWYPPPPQKKNKSEIILRYYRYKHRAIWKVSLLGLLVHRRASAGCAGAMRKIIRWPWPRPPHKRLATHMVRVYKHLCSYKIGGLWVQCFTGWTIPSIPSVPKLLHYSTLFCSDN